ncbi:YeeE/YedE family protein [Roseobacter sinensis]|uniref:YeeE/YedE family protein n=1 Tax=Roseobacter sinensis TaxID=2931391 RepID=A0ABT3BI48_9RHOB|nr:YeeE/YedE thiosulfate transporter family protein [Roseobacter sp. WL0113]MCV3272789.1 YeeE/YedE family protein [Roseobacter sp. WL0113]
METEFTPLWSLGGGVLIGLAATLLMATLGRIMGATGILAGALMPPSKSEFAWRAAVLAGMISGPLVIFALSGAMPVVQIPVSISMLTLGGLVVGVGVTFASGCTSGHGVCGMARLSPRSLVATSTFMLFTGATVFAVRHLWGG